MERAGFRVPEQERRLVDRHTLAQVALGQVSAESVQQLAQRRPFVTKAAVQGPRAES